MAATEAAMTTADPVVIERVARERVAMERAQPPAWTIYRHRLPVRIMHWINVICLFVMVGSGLQIFNAHPALYWGKQANFSAPLLMLGSAQDQGGNLRGVTQIGDHHFTTTGVLGVSAAANGKPRARGFPSWATLPGPQSLAMGRQWHFTFAWIFAINGTLYLLWTFLSKHFSRDLAPTGRDWRGIGRSIIDHMKFKHPHGEQATRYNVLQKLAYLVVILLLGPGIVLMGLAMSPNMDSILGWLVDLVGGRQSARTIHFIIAFGFIGFVLIHVFEVLVAGVWNEIRSMITGYYKVTAATEDSHEAE